MSIYYAATTSCVSTVLGGHDVVSVLLWRKYFRSGKVTKASCAELAGVDVYEVTSAANTRVKIAFGSLLGGFTRGKGRAK